MKKTLIISVLFMSTLLIVSCDSNQSSSNSSQSSSSNTKSGNYYFERDGSFFEITVSGNSWSGSTKICQSCDTEYLNGTIKGDDLYDETGYVTIGYFSGETISTSIGGSSVKLSK